MAELKEGFFKDIPIEDYHNWEKYPAISSSMIRTILKYSPLHVKSFMDGVSKPETKALLFGEISHDILLQNSISNYILQPETRENEKGQIVKFVRNGQHWDDFLNDVAGRPIVREKELEQLIKMHDQLMKNPLSKAIIENNTDIELSGFWKIDDLLWGKMRTDIINDNILVWSDYKTTTDASPEGFSRHFFSFGYDVQAAWYDRGIKELKLRKDYNCIYIAQEKDPPYAVGIFEIKPETIEIGKAKIEYALKIFRQCLENNEWPGYPEMSVIENQGWAISEADSYKLRL